METKFKNWTIIDENAIVVRGNRKYKCKCNCGTIKEIFWHELKSGKTTKCKKCCRMDIEIGSKFGCYTVLECAGVDNKRSLIFKCKCDCGAESIVRGVRLRKFSPSFCKVCRGLTKCPVGVKYGEWTVLGFFDIFKYKSRWKVKCSCGEEAIVNSNNILRGVSTRCYKCKNQKLKQKLGRCFTCTIYESPQQEILSFECIPPKFWERLYKNAIIRKLQFDITQNDLIELFKKQNGKCIFTGWPLIFHDNGRKCTVSVDRIDSEQGYVIDNVQIVHKHVNLMKNVFDQEYFIKMCKDIVENIDFLKE